MTTTPEATTTPAVAETPATPAPATPEPAAAAPGAKDWTALRAQEERLRRERETLKASAKQSEEALKFQAEVRRLAKENPEEAAKLAGLSYNDWTRARLRGTAKPDPVAEVRAELEKLKQETAAEKAAAAKAAEESQAKATESHWAAVTEQFTGLVKGSGEKHEFLRAELEVESDHVMQTLREMAAQRPTLTIDEAADLYETYLAGKVQRYLATAKARGMLSPVTPATTKQSNESPGAEIGSESGTTAATLTNGHAQERSVAASEPRTKRSPVKALRDEDDERIRRAMALVR
jgi:hypothetical protein